jgi:cellulose synthase/poly-beta-1,6-N-acetylglucosamine synthase-like glycosyltransferase
MDIPVLIFWSGISILLYTYCGYPALLCMISKFFSSHGTVRPPSSYWPKVDMLIAAYNEEKVIRDKIENCLNLAYPEEKLTVWIASDGSSDRTNDIVKEFMKHSSRIRLLEYTRSGKSGVINKALPQLEADITVFSDANTEYDPGAIQRMVVHFADPNVGCVCGRLIYRNPGEVVSGKGESFYWKYETALKKMESGIGYVAGANGAIYAIRRLLFEPLPPNTINDDFTISMRIVERGFKCLFEENAIAYEDVAPSMESEFRRHVRDGAGHYIAMGHLLGLLNPLLGMRSLIYWSHRILRWISPFILILVFIMNVFLIGNIFYGILFFAQILFYVLALIGLFSVKKSENLPLIMYVPFYFCNLNTALLYGFMRGIAGIQKTTWESTARS